MKVEIGVFFKNVGLRMNKVVKVVVDVFRIAAIDVFLWSGSCLLILLVRRMITGSNGNGS